jgi:hypothetical protein
MNTASPLDWVLAILLATSVLFGLRRGFVRTLIGVLSLILGNVLAALYYVQIGERLAQLVPQLRTVPYLPAVLGYVVVVFSVMLAASLTGRFLRGAARVAGLGTVDRVLGGCDAADRSRCGVAVDGSGHASEGFWRPRNERCDGSASVRRDTVIVRLRAS